MTVERTNTQSDPTPEEKKAGITQVTLENDDETVEMIQDLKPPSSGLRRGPSRQTTIQISYKGMIGRY